MIYLAVWGMVSGVLAAALAIIWIIIFICDYGDTRYAAKMVWRIEVRLDTLEKRVAGLEALPLKKR